MPKFGVSYKKKRVRVLSDVLHACSFRRTKDVPNGTLKEHVKKGRILNVHSTCLLDVLHACNFRRTKDVPDASLKRHLKKDVQKRTLLDALQTCRFSRPTDVFFEYFLDQSNWGGKKTFIGRRPSHAHWEQRIKRRECNPPPRREGFF